MYAVGVVEFELVREVPAPVADVFARLADIESYDTWMPHKGSIRRGSRVTSTGELGVGTTYVDQTVMGAAPGEVAAYAPPHEVVYHWWLRPGKDAPGLEGWPGYQLEATGPGTTRVRHHVRLQTRRGYQVLTPALARVARRERTATLDALVASFG
jgi:uncharacterized protein YndB with AHSA1/START domain